MAGTEGWIKLHRNIQEHWIWSDAQKLKWWLDIILLANHQDNKFLLGNEVMKVERGARHTSEILLAERWKVSRKKVRNFLDLLESEGMISTKKWKKGTTLKVNNYDVYQGFTEVVGTDKEQIKNTYRTDKEHIENKCGTDKEQIGNIYGTDKGTRTRMNKNYKNDKKEKNDKRMKENEEENTKPHPPTGPTTEVEKAIFNNLGDVAFGTWFKDADIKETETDIKIKTDGFKKEVIQKKYLETLNKILPKNIILED